MGPATPCVFFFFLENAHFVCVAQIGLGSSFFLAVPLAVIIPGMRWLYNALPFENSVPPSPNVFSSFFLWSA